MVAQLFQEVGAAITGMISALSSALTGVSAIFYDSTNGFTFLGILLLIAIGVGIVYFGLRLTMRLIRRA